MIRDSNRVEETTPLISNSTECLVHTKASSVEIFWHEMRIILQSAVTISGSLLVEFSFTFVPVAFIGHFSTPALAALCLGSMTANLTGISILRGLSSPLETMLPSAHTSGRPDLLALWTQRTSKQLDLAPNDFVHFLSSSSGRLVDCHDCAPISAAISWGIVPVISIIYGVFSVPDAAWHPISLEIFTNLGELTRLGLYSVAQVASEWWAWEILALAASFLGPVSTASQSVLTTLACVAWQVGASVSTAVNVRVGHHLGAMDHRRARGAANASIFLVLLTSILLSSSYMFFREPLARLISNDPGEDIVTSVM
ncbi:hypothetical protein H2248_002259 [Termitomyces sp. 'cryptogamus']|nr:hypothetical protein H2248_002259 [Termitomyces sp. 'cryptogamus']